jgi:hypothetical protein
MAIIPIICCFRSVWKLDFAATKSPARGNRLPEKGVSRSGEYDVHRYLLCDAHLISGSGRWSCMPLSNIRHDVTFKSGDASFAPMSNAYGMGQSFGYWQPKAGNHLVFGCPKLNLTQSLRDSDAKTYRIPRRRRSFRRCTKPSKRRSVVSFAAPPWVSWGPLNVCSWPFAEPIGAGSCKILQVGIWESRSRIAQSLRALGLCEWHFLKTQL